MAVAATPLHARHGHAAGDHTGLPMPAHRAFNKTEDSLEHPSFADASHLTDCRRARAHDAQAAELHRGLLPDRDRADRHPGPAPVAPGLKPAPATQIWRSADRTS